MYDEAEKGKKKMDFRNFLMKKGKKDKNEEDFPDVLSDEIQYRDPVQYEKYVKKRFECMAAKDYRVIVTPRLYYRATKDKKIKRWLEENLAALPFCMKSVKDIITVTGGCIVSCTYHMINYNNISTDVCVTDETGLDAAADPGRRKSSVIRTTTISEIETQVKYNSIFWTPEIESAGFRAQA